MAQNNRPTEAISLLKMTWLDGVESNIYSMSAVIRASARLAALEQMRALHGHTVLVGIDLDLVVGTALVNAYGKSGMVIDAHKVFDRFKDVSNVVIWNAMLAACAQQGDANATLEIFDEMTRRKGFVPDEYTFLAMLSSCSNAGLVDETSRWLDLMRSCYKVEPIIEHYTCFIGVMARAGRLEEAEKIACSMPFEADAAVWRTLLLGCVLHRSIQLAQRAAQRLVELNPRDESAYIMLANIYSSIGRKDDMADVLAEMRDRGAKKENGNSWIEVRGEAHEFVAGDKTHRRTIEIYEKVKELVRETKRLGYVEEDERVWYHCERLALALAFAFAIVNGSTRMEGKALRVLKDLRICGDCMSSSSM